jgi:hypothetical protein
MENGGTRMMVPVTVVMMIRLCKSGGRQECNYGKQQRLFHISDDKRLET